jgi:cytochrome c oxidase subunit 2
MSRHFTRIAFALMLTGTALAASAQGPAAVQDALQPAGPQAEQIEELWWLMLAVCASVFAAVVLATLWAVLRGRRADEHTTPELHSAPRRERGAGTAVGVAAAVCALLLVALVVASIFTDRALAKLSPQDELHIELTGHQWWWEAGYVASVASQRFQTANELHIPVGRTVQLTLRSADVIHSFWVPNLHGKRDLIPGRTATFRLRADRPGHYRGQCAEFCGFQHAYMALLVVAEPPDAYERWAAAQRQSATEPTAPDARRGKDVFMGSSCVMCHTITGTDAQGRNGPDLTHVGSRAFIAAGRLPTTREHLAAWIADPQAHKPGVNMPAQRFSPQDLQALAAYLEGLK